MRRADQRRTNFATTEDELESRHVQFATIPTGIELARGPAPVIGGVLSTMQQLASDGMTMVVVTHEMSFARDIAAPIVFMDDGVFSRRVNLRARFSKALQRPLPDLIPEDSRYHPRPGQGFANLPRRLPPPMNSAQRAADSFALPKVG